MKKTDYLITLGETWIKKYASVDAESIKPEIEKDVWQAIRNAAESQSGGMTNFVEWIDHDQATLSFSVVRNDTLGFKNIKVIDLSVSPSSLSPKYLSLKGDIEKYLNNNWEIFPSMSNNQAIEYNRFAIYLRYAPQQSDLVAGN